MTNLKPIDNMTYDSQKQSKQLSVILPAYGEADNLKVLLPALQSIIKELVSETEILVIDTESPLDDTQQVCLKYGATYIPRSGGNNYGDAIRTGIAASSGDYVVIMDADGSHNPNFIRTMWAKRQAVDIIIASRYMPGGHTDNPWLLVAMSRILNLVFKMVVGLPVLDVSNSFRLYQGDSLRAVDLACLHFDIQEEILAKMFWNNTLSTTRILEIPIRFERRKHGKPKRNLIIFGIRYLIVMYHLRKLRHAYQSQMLTETS